MKLGPHDRKKELLIQVIKISQHMALKKKTAQNPEFTLHSSKASINFWWIFYINLSELHSSSSLYAYGNVCV